MIIGKPEARNATVLGRPFLAPSAPDAPERRAPESLAADTEPTGADTASAFEGRLGLRRICERLERSIEALGDDVLRRGPRGADRKIIAMFGKFAAEADRLVDDMAPGPDRDAVAEAARRDGASLLHEAVATLDAAGERHAVAQIAGVRDGLMRRVAADPSRLLAARRVLEDMADAGELSDARADAVKREGVTALEAAVRGPDASAQDAVVAAAEVERPNGLPAPADELPDGLQGDRPGRNEILEARGFEFTDAPGGGFWTGPGGDRASPAMVRALVVAEIEERAVSEGWSSARVLTELHRARQGLPKDDERNVETAFAFLPVLPFLVGGGAGAGTGAGASITAAGIVKAILGGFGLAAILGLSGDTPLNDIEPAEDEAVDRAASAPDGGGPDDGRRGPGLGIPPPSRRRRKRDEEDVIVYRVEGETWARVLIDAEGNVLIPLNNTNMLHLNFGDFDRAKEFLIRRLNRRRSVNPTIKSFRVPKTFLDDLRAAAIKQKGAKKIDPGKLHPQIDDPNQADDQFGLPEPWIRDLVDVIKERSGVIITPEDVGLQPQEK